MKLSDKKQKELVSFGQYLLSEKRKKRFEETESNIPIDERMSKVTDTDIANWAKEH
jgi:hypothetical protein